LQISCIGLTLDTRLLGHRSTGPLAHIVLIGGDWQKSDFEGLRKAAKVSTTAIAIDLCDPVHTKYDIASVLVNRMSESGPPLRSRRRQPDRSRCEISAKIYRRHDHDVGL